MITSKKKHFSQIVKERTIPEIKNLVRAIFFIIILLPSFSVYGLEKKDSSDEKMIQAGQAFETNCPKPDWWDSVSASHIPINSYDDLIKHMRDKERSEEQFFKAAYKAIINDPLNGHLVVNAINFMHYTKSYSHRIALQEYAVERFFYYENSEGKPGNTIAAIVRHLGQLYNEAEQYNKSVDLIERLLKEREKEINDHLLELLHAPYAVALHRLGRKDDAINVLQVAINKYRGAWEHKLKRLLKQFGGSIKHLPPIKKEDSGIKQKESIKTKVIIAIGLAIIIIAILLRIRKKG